MKKFITIIAVLVLAYVVVPSTAHASCSITSFTASDTSIGYGDSTTVSWTSTGCDTVSITPAQYPDNRPPSGSTGTGPLTQTTTFTATGYSGWGQPGGSRSVTITVGGQNGGNNCHPTSFTAQEYTVNAGDGTVLHWDSEDCTSAAIHPAAYPGDRPPYGSIATGAIFHSTEFTLTVYDAQGNIGGQRFLTVNVRGSSGGSDDCKIDSFDADDTTIEEGDSTDLSWDTTDCDYVTLTGVSGHLNANDSRSVHPTTTKTYTLKAYDENDTLGDTDTITIHVDEESGEECSIDSFTASPSSIDRGDDSTLRWSTSGDIDYVTVSGISGNRPDDGSVTVSPYSTTTYTLRAYCNNGDSETDTVSVRVNNTQVSSQPQAITTVATILGGTQARLNGIAVPNTSDSTTRTWFEWGTSGSFGNRTNSQTVANGFASQYYSDAISGLVSGGTYYYRAVVQNNNGTAYGDTVRFQTQRTTVVTTTPPVIVRSTTSTVVAKSAPSLLELRVESNYDHMCVGGFMDYTVSYRNISSQTLENTVLRFTHPKEITYISSSRGEYDVVDRTMTIELGNVRPGEQGTITIHARVNDSAIRGNLTVATATVVYTNTVTRAQEDAIAYALITVSDDCPNILGASAVGFGSFLPNTLLGWLLLILVILALIVLGRQFYKKTERPQ